MEIRIHSRFPALGSFEARPNRAAACLQRLLLRKVVIALFALLFSVSSLYGERLSSTESQVEAAYLYNFGKFVRWPDRVTGVKGRPFTICVFGQDPLGPALDSVLAGENMGGSEVIAKRISVPQEIANCQILFISSSEESQLRTILDAVDKAAILTVSDMPQFSERGGMIHFVREGNRVRFEVNLTATQNCGLTLSSELLKVAATVRRSRAPRE
ncbi:MAG: YfiR family protein [Bryobacteraceae bacterium]